MELAVVKITDLKSFLSELKALKVEVKELREQENLKSYSVQETADKLGMSYNSVRKLIQENKLKVNYLNEKKEKGKCTVPAWSIKQYLFEKQKK